MFKVKYWETDEDGLIIDYHNFEILTVYNVVKSMFLVYDKNEWKWINMNDTEPYIKVVGM